MLTLIIENTFRNIPKIKFIKSKLKAILSRVKCKIKKLLPYNIRLKVGLVNIKELSHIIEKSKSGKLNTYEDKVLRKFHKNMKKSFKLNQDIILQLK